MITPVYSGSGPLRVAWLFSGGASSAVYCIDNPAPEYQSVVALTNDPEAPGISKLRDRGLEAAIVPDRDSIREDGWRERYYDRVLDELEKYRPDVVACSGWMLIIKGEMLQKYPHQSLNVHPAWLSIVSNDRIKQNYSNYPTSAVEAIMRYSKMKRRYTGDDAVFDAILDGERETVSTIHFVDGGKDTGPIAMRSDPLPVDESIHKYQEMIRRPKIRAASEQEARRVLREYSNAHQERQKWECDGPVFSMALRLTGQGILGFGPDRRTVHYKSGEEWVALPYGGMNMKIADEILRD